MSYRSWAVYAWQEWPQYFRGRASVFYHLEGYPLGMPEPRLDRADDRVYFTDAGGVKWRVRDVAFDKPHAKPYH